MNNYSLFKTSQIKESEVQLTFIIIIYHDNT